MRKYIIMRIHTMQIAKCDSKYVFDANSDVIKQNEIKNHRKVFTT